MGKLKGKKVVAFVLFVVMTFSAYTSTFGAETVKVPELADNVGYGALNSYIYANKDGTYTVVNHNGKVKLVHYDDNFKYISENSIRLSMGKFGGYYYDGTYHYVVSGDDNTSGVNNCDVYKIEKYDKRFKRLSYAIIKGSGTSVEEVFLTGGVDFDVTGDLMTIVDMTYDKKDGLGNYYINVNLNEMEIVNHGYFNKFVKSGSFDTTSSPLVVYSHENYPAICGTNQDNLKGVYITATEYSNNDKTGSVRIIGSDDKTTYMNLETKGFDISSDNFIVSGHCIKNIAIPKYSSANNVFIATVPRTTLNESNVNENWITNYKDSDEVEFEDMKLVKINNNKFMLIWQEKLGNGEIVVKYVQLDKDGKMIGKKTVNRKVKLSSCDPIVKDDTVMWYAVEKGKIKFYSIPIK